VRVDAWGNGLCAGGQSGGELVMPRSRRDCKSGFCVFYKINLAR
jgi:hypothetical protein